MDYLLVNKIREKGTEKDKMIYFYSVHFMNNIQNAMKFRMFLCILENVLKPIHIFGI